MAKKKTRTASKKRSVSKARSKPAAVGGKYLGHYGWTPDVPDQRDLVYAAPAAVTAPPPSVDMRPGCPPVYDQGQLGSCTANAIAGAIQYEQMRQKEHQPFAPSRLFIYYNERVMEHTVSQDAGAQIRDGIKSVNHIGACPETDWPYVIANFAKKLISATICGRSSSWRGRWRPRCKHSGDALDVDVRGFPSQVVET